MGLVKPSPQSMLNRGQAICTQASMPSESAASFEGDTSAGGSRQFGGQGQGSRGMAVEQVFPCRQARAGRVACCCQSRLPPPHPRTLATLRPLPPPTHLTAAPSQTGAPGAPEAAAAAQGCGGCPAAPGCPAQGPRCAPPRLPQWLLAAPPACQRGRSFPWSTHGRRGRTCIGQAVQQRLVSAPGLATNPKSQLPT